jgi:hypothetical protein
MKTKGFKRHKQQEKVYNFEHEKGETKSVSPYNFSS